VTWVERPLQEIMIHLRETPMAALIKTVDPESWISRLMFTPLDVHLLRECEVPLHFVNKVAHARPRKILAAIDPFHHDGRYQGLNDRILGEANKLAASCDAELEVIYAYDLSSITAAEYGFGNGSTFFSSTLARQLYESQGAAFDALAERNGIAPEQRRMIMGDPAKVLASYAGSHEIDVVVMGRVRYGGLDKLIGSTVESLLYKMPCSLWVIAPQQFD
jgi:universal stress protein E